MKMFFIGCCVGLGIISIIACFVFLVIGFKKNRFNMFKEKRFIALLIALLLLINVQASLFRIDSVYGYIVVTSNVMNGFGTDVIGKYGYTTVNKDEMSTQMLLYIYNNNVKDSNYNWFTIKFDDGTGIQFQGCTEFPVYGYIDEDCCVYEDIVNIMPIYSNEKVYGFKEYR